MNRVSNLSAIQTNDLMEIAREIQAEIDRRTTKLVDGLAVEINAKIRQILANGFEVKIETPTDEMVVTHADRYDVAVVAVAPE